MTQEQKDFLVAKALGKTPVLEEPDEFIDFEYSNNQIEDTLPVNDLVDGFTDPDESLRDLISFDNEDSDQETPEPEPEAELVRELSMEEKLREQAFKALSNIPGAPTPAQIAQLKQKYGDDGVYLLALGKKDVFIFTYLTKARWDLINKNLMAANKPDSKIDPNEILKEKVVLSSVLWPKLDNKWLLGSKAGNLNTLFEAIMMASYFLNQGQIAALTHEL